MSRNVNKTPRRGQKRSGNRSSGLEPGYSETSDDSSMSVTVNISSGSGRQSRSRNRSPRTPPRSTPRRFRNVARRLDFDDPSHNDSPSSRAIRNSMRERSPVRSRINPQRRTAPDQRRHLNEVAGLVLPITKVKHMMKTENYASKINNMTPPYLTAVLEYLTIELLEISGNACKRDGKRRIQPKHILRAVRNDRDLKYKMWNTVISKAGHAARIGPEPF